MYDITIALKGGPGRQHQVFDVAIHSLKRLLPYFTDKAKELVRINKILAGEEDWTCVKEVMGWTVETGAGIVALP